MPAWTDSERSKMFLAMIELMAPPGSSNKLPSWTMVADRMGSGFTGEAVRQQFQKCRKEGLPRQAPPRNRPQTSKRHRSTSTTFNSCGLQQDDDESQFVNGKKIKTEGKVMMGGLGFLPPTDHENLYLNNGYLPSLPPVRGGPAMVKMEPIEGQTHVHAEQHSHLQIMPQNGILNPAFSPTTTSGSVATQEDDDENIPLVQQRNMNLLHSRAQGRTGDGKIPAIAPTYSH